MKEAMFNTGNQLRLDDLINSFNNTFYQACNVKLISDGEEPIYLPADNEVSYNRIIFTKDYFSSALHEIAHWCIAGEARRKEIDFGY